MNIKTLQKIRAFSDDDGMILEGYALKFDKPATHKTASGDFTEVIRREALNFSDLSNVVLNREHKDEYTVARTSNNTLQLTVDEIGLKIIARLSENQASKDLYADVKNGLLTHMSFRAEFVEDNFIEGDVPMVEIKKLGKFFDVAVCAHPFYDATEVTARNLKTVEDVKPEMETEVETEMETETETEMETETETEMEMEMETETETETETEPETETEIEVEPEAILEENMEILKTQKTEMNLSERNAFKNEIARNAFLANMGSVEARENMVEIKERATAFGLTELLDNHTPESLANAIPQVLQDRIIEVVKDYSDVMNRVEILNVRGDLKFLAMEDGITAKFLADAEPINSSAVSSPTATIIKGNRVASMVYVSNELLSASIAVLENYLIANIGRALATEISNKIFNGDGVTAPQGVVTVATDVTGQLTDATNLFEQLQRVPALLPTALRSKVSIYMNRTAYFNEYLTIADTTGQPIAGVTPTSFYGMPVVVEDAIANDNVLVADFSEYTLNFSENVNVTYSDDFKFDQSVRTYRGEAVVGGGVRNKQAFLAFVITE